MGQPEKVNRQRETATDIDMVTQEDIARWKALYGKVFEYTAREGGKEWKGYFKPITPEVLDAYEKTLKKSKLAGDSVVIESCWLGGDEEIKKRDDLSLGLREWLGLLLVKVEGEMVEL